MESDHKHTHQSTENISIAFFLNLFFTILEIIGGIMTNSMAILSDAVHDLGDSFSLGLAWWLDRYSKKKADINYSFGYSRFSLLGALINSIVLIIGSTIVLLHAIPRLFKPEVTNAKGMFIFAVLGVLINGAAALKLHGGKSLNEKVVSWHLLEDVLGWAAVLIVSIILFFKKMYILDPILSIAITIYILFNVIKNLIKIIKIFLQKVPENISIDDLEEKIINLANVKKVHHTHVWTMDGEHNYLSTHVVLSEDFSFSEQDIIKENIKKMLKENNIHHITLELEKYDYICDKKECDF